MIDEGRAMGLAWLADKTTHGPLVEQLRAKAVLQMLHELQVPELTEAQAHDVASHAYVQHGIECSFHVVRVVLKVVREKFAIELPPIEPPRSPPLDSLAPPVPPTARAEKWIVRWWPAVDAPVIEHLLDTEALADLLYRSLAAMTKAGECHVVELVPPVRRTSA